MLNTFLKNYLFVIQCLSRSIALNYNGLKLFFKRHKSSKKVDTGNLHDEMREKTT